MEQPKYMYEDYYTLSNYISILVYMIVYTADMQASVANSYTCT